MPANRPSAIATSPSSHSRVKAQNTRAPSITRSGSASPRATAIRRRRSMPGSMIAAMGRLTTHVLDTAAGRPAGGVAITLRRDGAAVAEAATNADGRTDVPLAEGGPPAPGAYEITFAVGAYFGGEGFLDDVPVRFRVDDADASYHVPLLCSPWSYATYRGS